ncbi:MAG: peptidoglycan-associated lipoprotein Pal [Thermodesulfobacteriota bacterium]
MKYARRWLVLFLVVALAFSFSCAKKTIRSDAVRYSPPRATEVKPETTEAKPEAASPESSAALEREKKLQEENLREESLREKALREKSAQEEAARKEAATREAASKATNLEALYFDFDQWSIREDQKDVLQKNAEWLKANPKVKVRLEGHCDERGTAEYNLALGQKRAEAANAFLEGLGIAVQRISAISYGKERPLDPGHDEAAWAKNRRVDIVMVR